MSVHNLCLKSVYIVLACAILYTCSIPPPAYILNAPNSFQCSTDYDPKNPEIAKWSIVSCSSPAWIRFLTYAPQVNFEGWVFYKGNSGDNFIEMVQSHMAGGIISPLDSIINNITQYTPSGSGSCTQGDDKGQIYPTISVNPIPQNSDPDKTNSISGFDTYKTRSTFIVIPPLNCLSGGTFVVTAADYRNKSESYPSNELTLN